MTRINRSESHDARGVRSRSRMSSARSAVSSDQSRDVDGCRRSAHAHAAAIPSSPRPSQAPTRCQHHRRAPSHGHRVPSGSSRDIASSTSDRLRASCSARRRAMCRALLAPRRLLGWFPRGFERGRSSLGSRGFRAVCPPGVPCFRGFPALRAARPATAPRYCPALGVVGWGDVDWTSPPAPTSISATPPSKSRAFSSESSPPFELRWFFSLGCLGVMGCSLSWSWRVLGVGGDRERRKRGRRYPSLGFSGSPVDSIRRVKSR